MYKKTFRGLVLALSISALCPALANAQGNAGVQNGQGQAEVNQSIRHDVSPPLRDIAPLKAKEGREEKPLRYFQELGSTNQKDPVVQSFATPAVNVAVSSGFNFEGVGEGLTGYNVNVAPPDTNGAVGATQYVQWVNLSFAVFDKSSGNMVYGPAAGNTLWAGFGGPCETRNDGDPIVQYDKAAGRWVMTQFALSNGNYQCVAVSTTSDATGAYARYQFGPYTDLNDYPKMGVWSDGYYITFNMFRKRGINYTFAGAKVCAYDRAKMIAGQAATQQCVQLSSSFGGLLPSDLDGSTAPPAGSPNYLLNFGSNSLNLWKFKVDWANTANTRLTGPTNMPVAAFSTACAGGTCIPQPGTSQKLDSLGDRLMYRLAYRNFGDHESLVVNHSVKVNSSGQTGVRWYEVRSPNGTASVYQQGTYAPNSDYRWMGSVAMDKLGNMAVGYSVSSTATRPSIRFAARAAGDPLGTLGLETSIKDGTGSQLSNLARWGDYSSLSVDPTDDCTMWYTTEYIAVNGTFNWHTRIASFKLGGCQ